VVRGVCDLKKKKKGVDVGVDSQGGQKRKRSVSLR
jgi:hypothetical protein